MEGQDPRTTEVLNRVNAPGLPGGSLRSWLHAAARAPLLECPRLARGIVTFVATTRQLERPSSNAPGLPGGSLRSWLPRGSSSAPPRMPPACPGDRYVRGYHAAARAPLLECPRLARGIVTFVATTRQLERPSSNAPGLLRESRCGSPPNRCFRASSVRLPRASRGHLGDQNVSWGSGERNDPPGKPGAFTAAHSRPPTVQRPFQATPGP